MIYRRIIFGIVVCLCALGFNACHYEVPITSSPTRKVQEQLLGNWVSLDGKENMRVRRLDDSTYVVYYDGDLFRAYHSDVGEMPLASVQDLNSNDRKYAYVVWKLSSDGKGLTLRNVNNKVIPKETKDSAALAALVTKNARNPELFGEEIEFRKEKYTLAVIETVWRIRGKCCSGNSGCLNRIIYAPSFFCRFCFCAVGELMRNKRQRQHRVRTRHHRRRP